MSVFSFHNFICSLISVSKKRNIETMLTLPYSYNWQKFDNKMNEKKKPGVSEYGSWNYGKTSSRILELLLKRFCRLIFAPSRKS